MCKLCSSIFIVFFLGVLSASPSGAVKIKHQGSVYTDNDGLSLKHPEGVACSDNSFVVADTGNSRVVRYAMNVQGLTPEAVYPLPKMSPIVAQTSSSGEILLLDGKSRQIVKMSSSGQVMGKVEPKALPDGKTFIPRSFKMDESGNLYLLDVFAERVMVLSAAEEYVRELAFPEGYRSFSDLAVDSQGAIYLLDSVAGAVYVARRSSEAFELLNDNLKEYMNFPAGMAVDSNGVIYLSDKYGSGLALFGRDGSFQGRKFGMGWEEGQLYYPAQLCINQQDVLFVADRNNSRVQVFNILNE